MTARSLAETVLAEFEDEEITRAREHGAAVKERVVNTIIDARDNSARSQQATARVLGMSDLGGCREFIRATIAGDPKSTRRQLKWPAEVGTAVGDFVEAIMGENGMDVQETVTLTLPGIGIQITGHLDEIDVVNGDLIDNKTVNGLGEVKRDGPSDKYAVQISGYLVAAVQEGRLQQDAVGTLMFFDRSGAEPDPYVWSITYKMALSILDWARERLLDVQHALSTGSREDRDGRLMTDEPESYCWAIGCPFYDACWAGYTPTETIEHPRIVAAVDRFIQARDDEVDAAARRKAARDDLRAVEGIVDVGPNKGTVVRWTLAESQRGTISDRLDVRKPKV